MANLEGEMAFRFVQKSPQRGPKTYLEVAKNASNEHT